MKKIGLLAMGMLVVTAGALHAQSPSSCTKDAGDWFNIAYKAARDSAARPGGKPADTQGLLNTRTEKMKACASKFTVAATSGADLLELSALYSSLGMDTLARAAVAKRLAEPGLAEIDQAKALVASIRTYVKPDTLVIAKAEPLMARLDKMSDAVLAQKLDAHNSLNGEYRYLDVNSRIRQHSLAIIALTRGMKTASMTAQRDPNAVMSYTVLGAYSNLAEVYGDFGQADSAIAMLHQATIDHPEISQVDADNYLKSGLERYALVGTKAPSVEAAHWLNAPAGTKSIATNGKVTVIEFTAHWCIPCRNSYPSMTAMETEFAKQGVQFVFATQFYGYVGAKRNLSPADELIADEEYFGAEHGVRFPVGVADAPPSPKPGQAFGPAINTNPNDLRFHVSGIPQTVIIDRNGVIRRILTGWDTGNAQRLPILIAQLAKEKPTKVVP